jgi:hypothetical protein
MFNWFKPYNTYKYPIEDAWTYSEQPVLPKQPQEDTLEDALAALEEIKTLLLAMKKD